MRGTMIWFNEEKDHGYIATREGERLYIDGSGFAGGQRLKGRCNGIEVEFEVAERDGERMATGCVLVEEVAPRRARRHGGSR
jgi:cold shock CspA family protein